MRDLKNSIKAVPSLPIGNYGPLEHEDGDTVDRLGFESAAFLVSVGDLGDCVHSISAEHSDNGADWDAVAAEDLVGSFPVIIGGGSPLVGEHSASVIGYMGSKRYLRAVADINQPSPLPSPILGAVYGVTVILGHAHSRPT